MSNIGSLMKSLCVLLFWIRNAQAAVTTIDLDPGSSPVQLTRLYPGQESFLYAGSGCGSHQVSLHEIDGAPTRRAHVIHFTDGAPDFVVVKQCSDMVDDCPIVHQKTVTWSASDCAAMAYVWITWDGGTGEILVGPGWNRGHDPSNFTFPADHYLATVKYISVLSSANASRYIMPSQECTRELGFQSGHIVDGQFDASSVKQNVYGYWPPWRARLHDDAIYGMEKAGWIPRVLPAYLQVDLLLLHELSAISWQSVTTGNVSAVELSVGETLSTITDIRTLSKNLTDTVVLLDPTVVGRYVRVTPLTVVGVYSMQIELHGCPKDFPSVSTFDDELSGPSGCPCSDLSLGTYGACPAHPEIVLVAGVRRHYTRVTAVFSGTTQMELDGLEPTISYQHLGQWVTAESAFSVTDPAVPTGVLSFSRLVTSQSLKVNLATGAPPGTWCAALTVHGKPALPCPPEYVYSDGSCYRGIHWVNTENTCSHTTWANQSGHGAVVTSFNENVFIKSITERRAPDRVLITGLPRYYLGANRPGGVGPWITDTGEIILDFPFSSGEPTSGDTCILLDLYGFWDAQVCGGKNAFLCEVQAEDFPINCTWAYTPAVTSNMPMPLFSAVQTSLESCMSLCLYGAVVDPIAVGCRGVTYNHVNRQCSGILANTGDDPLSTLITDVTGQHGTYELFCADECYNGVTGSAGYSNTFESSSATAGYAPSEAYLHNPIKYWKPTTNDKTQWISVSFPEVMKFTRIATQGSGAVGNCLVRTYVLASSDTGTEWTVYRENLPSQNEKVFTGYYIDYNEVKLNSINPAIEARMIMIIPRTWVTRICLRLQLYGCPAGRLPIELPPALGMESKDITSGQLWASSIYMSSSNHYPDWRGRLGESGVIHYAHPYWRHDNSDTNPFYKIDLLTPHLLEGFASKGGDSSLNYVTKYKLEYKDTGSPLDAWTPYLEDSDTGIITTAVLPQIAFYVPFVSPFRASQLRFFVAQTVGLAYVQLEVYGRPIALPDLNDSLLAGVNQTTVSPCTCPEKRNQSICLDTEDDYTIEYDRLMLVTGVILTVSGTGLAPPKDLNISYLDVGRNWLNPRRIDVNQSTNGAETSFDYSFAPLIRTTAFMISTHGLNSLPCGRITLQGREAPACPPFMVYSHGKCHRSDVKWYNRREYSRDICESFYWGDVGHYPEPRDIYDMTFLSTFYYRQSSFYLGFDRTGNATMPWITEAEPARTWEYYTGGYIYWWYIESGQFNDVTYPYMCVHGHRHGAFALSSCTSIRRYACETKASKNSCDVEWTIVRNKSVYRANLAVEQVSEAECLQACLEVTDFECRSAEYDRMTLTCTLADVHRNSLGVQISTAWNLDYYEPHCASDIEQPLLWNAMGELQTAVKVRTNVPVNNFPPEDAWINSNSKACWDAYTDNNLQWYEMDFGRIVIINRLSVRGGGTSEGMVTTMNLLVSNHTLWWSILRDSSGAHRTFHVASNTYSYDTRNNVLLDRELYTRFLRVRPLTWFSSIKMRLEVFGQTSLIQPKICGLYLQSYDEAYTSKPALFELNGDRQYVGTNNDKIVVYRVDTTYCSVIDVGMFNTYTSTTAADELVDYINSTADGIWLALITRDRYMVRLTNATSYLEAFGLPKFSRMGGRSDAFACVFQKGYPGSLSGSFLHQRRRTRRHMRHIGPIPEGSCRTPVGIHSGEFPRSQYDVPSFYTQYNTLGSQIALLPNSQLRMYSADYTAWNIYDGWQASNITDNWIELTFNVLHEITAVILAPNVHYRSSGARPWKISFEMSNDSADWQQHTDQNGNLKVYEGIYDVGSVYPPMPLAIDLDPTVIGVGLRIYVSTYSNGVPIVQAEVLGCPVDMPPIKNSNEFQPMLQNDASLPVNWLEECGTSGESSPPCLQWCTTLSNAEGARISLDLNYMFLITGFTLNTSNGINYTTADDRLPFTLLYNPGARDHDIPALQKMYVQRTENISETGVTRYRLSPVMRVKTFVIILDTIETEDVCYRLTFNGKLAPACPAGAAHYKNTCVFSPGDPGTSLTDIQDTCDTFTWLRDGYPYRMYDYEDIQMVGTLVNSRFKSTGWGVRVDGTWSSGDNEYMYLDGSHGYYGNDSWVTGSCQTVYGGGYQSNITCHPRDKHAVFLCETPANVIPEDNCSYSWFMYERTRLSPTNVAHLEMTVLHEHQCLGFCVAKRFDLPCVSFNYDKVTKLCTLIAANSTMEYDSFEYNTLSNDDLYFETQCRSVENCNTPIFETYGFDSVVADLSVSSHYWVASFDPSTITLNAYPSWRTINDTNIWIKITMNGIMVISGIAMRGGGKYYHTYVTSFRMAFLKPLPETVLIHYDKYTGNEKVFVNNMLHQSTKNVHDVDPEIITRELYILPNSASISMRFELYGCEDKSESPPSSLEIPLGMESGDIGLTQLAESAHQIALPAGYQFTTHSARPTFELTDNLWVGWGGNTAVLPMWFQIDLLHPHHIRYLIINNIDVLSTYYIKWFHIHHSIELGTWNTMLDLSGAPRVITGIDQAFALEYQIKDLGDNVTARWLRIEPKAWNVQNRLKVEVVGHVISCPNLTIAASEPAYKQLVVSHSSEISGHEAVYSVWNGETEPWDLFWRADPSDSTPWLEIDLRTLHSLTGLQVFNTSLASMTLEHTNAYNGSWTVFKKPYTNNEVLNITEGDVVTFARSLRVRKIKITAVSWSGNACLRIGLLACPLPGCPPNSIENWGKCYAIFNHTVSYSFGKALCEKYFTWMGPGRVVSPHTIHDWSFVQENVLNVHESVWAGVVYRDGEVVYDYNNETHPLPYPSNGFNCSVYHTRTKSSLLWVPCSSVNHLMCETDASEYDSINESRTLWMVFDDILVTNSPSTSYTSMNTSDCIDTCHRTDWCTAVQSDLSSCDLLDVTLNSDRANLQNTGKKYYEKYIEEPDCESRILNGLSPGAWSSSSVSIGYDPEKAVFSPELPLHSNLFWKSAAVVNIPEWIQIDLVTPHSIKRLDLINLDVNFINESMVTAFFLLYSSGDDWQVVNNRGAGLKQDFSIFKLDVNNRLIQYPFSPHLIATKLQFWILDHVNPSLPIRFQFDLIGCQAEPEIDISRTACQSYLGMQSGNIRDTQIKTASFKNLPPPSGYHWGPHSARLGHSANDLRQVDWEPHTNPTRIQIDLLTLHKVTGVIVQGRADSPTSTSTTSFAVDHARISGNWTMILNSAGQEKRFAGVMYNLPILHSFDQPILARYVRIHPILHGGAHLLRVELVGCPHGEKAIGTMLINSLKRVCSTQAVPGILNNTCADVCFDPTESPPSFLITLNRMHHVQSFVLTTSNATTIETLTVEIGVSNKSWIFYTANYTDIERNVRENEAQFTYTLPLSTLATLIRVNITQWTPLSIGCVRVEVFGEQATACPPGYARYGSTCYQINKVRYRDGAVAQKRCAADNWVNPGSLAVVNDAEINSFISTLFRTEVAVPVRVSLSFDGSQWEHTSGTPASWINWDLNSGEPNIKKGTCSVMFDEYGHLRTDDCNSSSMLPSYACQTDADPSVSTTVRWFSIPITQVTVDALTETPVLNLNATECLQLCEEDKGCQSVVHEWDVDKCYPLPYNRHGGVPIHHDTTKNAGNRYWERLMSSLDTCSDALLGGNLYGAFVTVSSSQNGSASDTILNALTGPWMPVPSEVAPFVQVEFTQPILTTGLMIRASGIYYVEAFRFKHNALWVEWNTELEAGTGNEVFTTLLTPSMDIRYFPLIMAPVATKFRLELVTWPLDGPTVKWELLGCPAGSIEVDVGPFTLEVGLELVRGYNISTNFSIILANLNDTLEISQLASPLANVSVTVYLSDVDKRTSPPGTEVLFLLSSIQHIQLAQRIEPLSSAIVDIDLTILIPRDTCPSLEYMCVEVFPGESSSYRNPAWTAIPVRCLDITAWRLCDGKPIEGVMFEASPDLVIINGNVEYNISWSQGTDVHYTVSFDDTNSTDWHWDVEGHIQEFMSLSTSTSHSYITHRNYTATLTIFNEVSTQIRTLVITVEPPLDQYLSINNTTPPQYTPVNVNFELRPLDTSFPLPVWCSAEFGDTESGFFHFELPFSPVAIVHGYTTSASDVVCNITCYNHVSNMIWIETVILQQAISGLSIQPIRIAYVTGEVATFNISMATGSHVEFNTTFGNGTEEYSLHPMLKSFENPFYATHSFGSHGNYPVVVRAYNKHFTANATLEAIYIQNAVQGLSFDGPSVVVVPPGQATFNITPDPDESIATPDEVICDIQLLDGVDIFIYSTNIMCRLVETFVYPYSRPDISGETEIANVSCYNLASRQEMSLVYSVHEELLNFLVDPMLIHITPNTTFNLTLTLSAGSAVNFHVEETSGFVGDFAHPRLFANESVYEHGHTFSEPGNYTVSIRASNPVNSLEQTVTVIVQNPITDLLLWINETVLWPPGIVLLEVSAGTSQLPLTDTHFQWTLDTVERPMYVPVINAAEPHRWQYTFPKMATATKQIALHCSNLVSSVFLNTTLEYILDEVLIANLRINGTVYWSNATIIEVDVIRFGTGACFLWDTADGSPPVIYGAPVCEQNATELGAEFIGISSDTKNHSHNHNFSRPGSYRVTLKAFNHVNIVTLSVNTTVPICNNPIVKTEADKEYFDPNAPYQHQRGLKLVFYPIVAVQCWKTTQFNTTWKVYVKGQESESALDTQDGISYVYTPRQLVYGVYSIIFVLTMNTQAWQSWDTSVVSTQATMYVEITKTPLLASIKGGLSWGAAYDRKVEMNAVELSEDPDVEPGDKEGLTFKWFCRTMDNNLNCFSATGPGGIISQTAGVWEIDTVEMRPRTHHIMRVEVSKDTRTSWFEQDFFVGEVDPPVIKLSCRENCLKKKTQSGSIVLRGECFEFCSTKYGSVQYLWLLFHVDNDDPSILTHFTRQQMENITHGGYEGTSIFIKPGALVGGESYKLVVYASTPGSPNGTLEYDMLINMPPYGGTCGVDPLVGQAGDTLFTLECVDWKEWKPSDPSVRLKYEYRIKALGAKRSMLLYYGFSAISTPVVFPVGNLDMEFLNTVELLIKDTVGDQRMYTLNVTVYPLPLPASQIAKEMHDMASGTNPLLQDQLAAGDFQGTVSSAYSVISVLNVPLDWVNPTTNDSTSLTAAETRNLTRQRAEARTLLMKTLAALPVHNVDDLDQSNELLYGLVLNIEELEFTAQNTGTDRVLTLAASYSDYNDALPLDKVKSTARDLMGTTVKFLIGADAYLSLEECEGDCSQSGTDQNETVTANPTTTMPSTTDPPSDTNVTGNITGSNQKRQQVGAIMSKLVTAVDDVAGTLLSRYEPDDPPTDIEFHEVSLSVGMETGGKLSHQTFTSLKGAIKMPGLLPEDASKTCLMRQIMFSRINPFILDESADNIKSPVVDFEFTSCGTDPARRRKRRSANNGSDTDNPSLGFDSPFVIELYLEDQRKNYINHTTTDQYGMLYHVINVTSNTPIQAAIYPIQSRSLNVYVGLDVSPTPTDNDMALSIPVNLTAGETAGLDLEYTVYISAANLTNTSQVFVGVANGECFHSDDLDCADADKNYLQYELSIGGSDCQTWDDKQNAWISQDCEWAILPLVDNYAEDQTEYELHVYTGFKSGAETDSNISMVVKGTEGDSGIRNLQDGIRQNFQRGEVSSFLMTTPYNIGIPHAIQIWHDNAGKGKKKGWYLAKIIIIDRQQKKWYLFTCDQWLAVDADDGRIERYLRVSRTDDIAGDSTALLQSNISRSMFDDHIWLSVGYRKVRSTFTRVQRLACCLATLFLSMVANAMWYGSGDENPDQAAFSIGPISFTVQELYTSFMSAVVMFPPIILITVLFVKAGGKPERSQGNVNNNNSNQRERGQWPHWCRYIAWVLVILSVLVGAFFTLLYSFEFGGEKSKAWLVAFFLSFFESLLFLQPLKVICLAIIFTFIYKEDSDVSAYEKDLGKTDTSKLDEVYLEEENALLSHIGADELEESRRKQAIDTKMRSMVKEIMYYLAFLILLLIVINGNQSEDVFWQNQNLRNVFVGNISKVRHYSQFWSWVEQAVLPGLYNNEDYNRQPLTGYDTKFISNQYSMRLGPPRFRQLRANKDNCTRNRFPNIRCTNWYSLNLEEQLNYYQDWNTPLNTTKNLPDALDNADSAYVYRSSKELKGEMYWGYLGYYSGGGYVANLGNTENEARAVISQLHQRRWVDQRTRAVFLEFNVWNANTNLFNLVVIILEFPPTGDAFTWQTLSSVQLYRYLGSAGVIALLSEIAIIIYVFVIGGIETRKMLKMRLSYFRNPWRVVQLLSLVLFFVAFGFYVHRSVLTQRRVEEMMNNREDTINLQSLATSDGYYILFMGLVAFFTQLQLLHLLRYNKTIAMLGATLAQSGKDLLSFSLVTMIVFLAFSTGAAQMFWQLTEYSTMQKTCASMASAFMGKFDFYSIYRTYGKFGAYYLLIYLDVMIFLMVDIFIVIINEFLAVVANDDTYVPDDHEVVEHFIRMLKHVITWKTKTPDPVEAEAEEENTKHDCKTRKDKEVDLPCEALLDRIDVLGHVAEAMSPDEETDIADVLINFACSPTPNVPKDIANRQCDDPTAKRMTGALGSPSVFPQSGILQIPRKEKSRGTKSSPSHAITGISQTRVQLGNSESFDQATIGVDKHNSEEASGQNETSSDLTSDSLSSTSIPPITESEQTPAEHKVEAMTSAEIQRLISFMKAAIKE